MTEFKHWSEVIAEKIVSEKKEPYVIASGITTSGPVHMGTVCEFLYPSALVKRLEELGYRTRFVFVGDIFDPFDSIPAPLKSFDWLSEHLGKPLSEVPDPYGCCSSYGEHFLNQAIEIMEKLDVHPEVLKANELYAKGEYDEFARFFIRNFSRVREVIEQSSMSKRPPDWKDILLPVCEQCGKIATTSVKAFDGDHIEYVCDKDVGYTKGCGYHGWTKISDHRYKLIFRLDWPSRHVFLNVSAEGAGVDHHTRGGTWDTVVAVHRKLFNREPPVGFKYGFVLLHGKKYSKSKGIGLGVYELLELVPPEIVKFVLLRPDLEENKEFDPSSQSLIRVFDEYNRAADLAESGRTDLSRGERKDVAAYRLSTDRRRWRVDFVDLLIHYQVYGDWDYVGQKLGDPEGVSYLSRYVANWVAKGFVPEEYVFRFNPVKADRFVEQLREFATRLRADMRAEDVHNLVYEVARDSGVEPREFFKALYLSLIGKDHGPRLGRLVVAIGVEKVRETLLDLYG